MNTRRKYRRCYEPVDLGALPVDAVNRTLQTELEPGEVRMSAAAHRHMAEDHPADYATCFAELPRAIADPDFVGQSPRHAHNFELVKRVRAANQRIVLVALGLDRDERGRYRVRSCYTIDWSDLDRRRASGHLRPSARQNPGR